MSLNGEPNRTVKDFCQHAEVVTLADNFLFIFVKGIIEIKILALDFRDTLIFVCASLIESMNA